MQLSFSTDAWKDYLYWQKTDKKILSKVNELIKECLRTPFHSQGKPEGLKGELAGYWSRRINMEQRFVYRVDDVRIHIIQCRKHY